MTVYRTAAPITEVSRIRVYGCIFIVLWMPFLLFYECHFYCSMDAIFVAPESIYCSMDALLLFYSMDALLLFYGCILLFYGCLITVL